MTKRKWTREEIEEYRKNHGTLFYFNKEDANVFVPKLYGFGRTMNFANPFSWLILVLVIGFAIWSIYFK